ncbi:NAD(P)/FAD-dependent oxidoreductase [Nocardioides carbamazepini]|uniref:flavin-containing monooxygenase n=1 Tax=Nocardioides carbamazepini TaxID=2854259 RepID=UPI00214A690A|nr:NAD(P)/FAD-dependent oxidoreductase [Nocardioides carbamazepini]MCR1783661.1 NAD(P)/FAD-dependent oxidoreductase [Nocardioides carbamazepini]
MAQAPNVREVDAIVIGAGFSGLHATKRLTDMGLSVRAFDAAEGVGGVWTWNRYPGARTDSLHMTYCYSFDRDLLNEWGYSEVNPRQPEVLAYLRHVADRFDLEQYYTFGTSVTSAVYDEAAGRWVIETDHGETVSATYFVTGLGLVSAPLQPTAPGLEKFRGEVHHTARWPHHEVDFAGKRVAVIGTGSSGVQLVATIADRVGSLTVFQRTANWVAKTPNRPVGAAELDEIRQDYDTIWKRVRHHPAGWPWEMPTRSALETPPDERERVFEQQFEEGGFALLYNAFSDLSTDKAANDLLCDFMRRKIQEMVDDPELAAKLTPTHPYGAKRPPTTDGYYQAFNKPNVGLVDLRETPIEAFTENGIRTSAGEHEFDMIVLATGFDAITGAFTRMQIRGVGGRDLNEYWSDGPKTYLGLAVPGFPNMFTVAGPQTPFSNLPPGAQAQGSWISDAISWMREHDQAAMHPTEAAAEGWTALCNEIAESLPATSVAADANSWFTGANVEGKAVAYNIYFGGHGSHADLCDEEAASEYPSFAKIPALVEQPA